MLVTETAKRGCDLFAGCLAVLFLCGAAGAQESELPADADALGEEVEEIRYYTVELIIFEYADTVSAGSEIFLPDEPPPQEETPDIPVFGDPSVAASDDFLMPEPEPEDVTLEEVVLPAQVELFMLDPADYTMNGIYEKLLELDAYKPLIRGGWTQMTADKDLAPSVRLRVLGTPPLRLDGSLTLYLSRYLHLVVDLTLEALSAESSEPPLVFGDNRAPYEYGYYGEERPPVSPIRYRIFEDRIFKNGDLRYFDHPRFGVLAKITRHEVLEDEDSDAILPDPITLVSPDE